ncbi:MAG: radical SAM protein [Candidatus Daviesbacteria bacterium]|nr:radical SAM protein [Candidatus Daviesbacteria bacterium]
MAKILFFNPPTWKNVYSKTIVEVGAPSYPNYTLALLAGNLVDQHEVKIIDLDLYSNYQTTLFATIKKFQPDIIGASAKTTDYLVIKEIMTKIKEKYPKIMTIVGGVHITVFPEEVIKEKCFDILALGEGDKTIPDILSAKELKNVPGIAFRDKKSHKIIFTKKRELIQDINKLTYPAWHLFDLNKYNNSRLSARKNPNGHLETSRGCSYQCNFCNKSIFGTLYRMKNVNRVVDEIEYMLKCGFQEIHIMDDSFTQNIKRAKEICREIIKRRLIFPWSLMNGIRVNFVDAEFFKLAKKAGCWQIGFGIESGDQRVLNKISKKITLAEVRKAVKLAEKEGIDTFGFFLLGLSGETINSMQKTIDFAKSLPLTTAKFAICIPHPGTPYFWELKNANRIKTFDWSKYKFHQVDEPLFDHPNLAWEQIVAYRKKGYREFYLRPSYAFRRLKRDIKMNDLLFDIEYFLKSVRGLF